MQAFEKHEQWPNVKLVLERLAEKGYCAWLAGGSVRDSILGIEPKDFDVVSNATPEQISALFPNALPIGKKFGIIIVPFKDYQIEIATFRKDGPYLDGRHPESIELATAEEDAKRRDFTVNALFFDPLSKKVIDYVGGQQDIKAKVIRAVGDPKKRFQEDKLRILRAFRFASQLGFELAEETYRATIGFSLKEVSLERIRDEFKKMLLSSDGVKALSHLQQSGFLQEVLPDVNVKPMAKLTLQAFNEKINFVSAMTLLLVFSEINNTASDFLLSRLKLSSDEKKEILFNLSHFNIIEGKKTDDSFCLRTFANGGAQSLINCFEAFAEIVPSAKKKLVELQKISTQKLPEAYLSSKDLMEAGISPGPLMGSLLKTAYDLQLKRQLQNKIQSLEWLKKQKPQ
ncbi:MAG: CCA tRNA nucleotidyltransferase [Pseudomonadota bacterium]|nr:CCA tRNA nucleotidyltransferase [Pseudomonadota bacterium]